MGKIYQTIYNFLIKLDEFLTRLKSIMINMSFIGAFIGAFLLSFLSLISKNLVIIPEINLYVYRLLQTLLIICACLILFYIFKYYYKTGDLKKSYILFLIFMLIVLAGVYDYMQPTIEITSPEDNAIINNKIDIEGNAKRIPKEDNIWAVQYSYIH